MSDVNNINNLENTLQDTNKKKFSFRKIWRIFKILVIVFFASSIGTVILYSFVPVFVTPLMIIRSVEKIFDGKKPKIDKKWVNIKNISNNMPLAVISGEDQNFVNHNGFDFEAMRIAYKNNKKGKRIHGASTISQQTAKNVFLWPSRNYIRKGLEVYFTCLIELFWSKKRIMEVYLNVIETGDGIYGVEAASQKYFKKSAKKLSKSEAAAIAASLPNPRRFNAAKQTNFFINHKAFIEKYMSYVETIKY